MHFVIFCLYFLNKIVGKIGKITYLSQEFVLDIIVPIIYIFRKYICSLSRPFNVLLSLHNEQRIELLSVWTSSLNSSFSFLNFYLSGASGFFMGLCNI